MKQALFENKPALQVSHKVLKDYEDLFLGKRSGHLTEYIYCGDVDYYEQLVQNEKNYYLTKTETEILTKYRYEIANTIGKNCNVIEIGPGPEYILKTKVIPLLKAFKKLSSYTALDIDIDYALQASKLIKNMLGVKCYAYEADCTKQLRRYHKENSCLLFLGSTLGNFADIEINNIIDLFARALNKGEYIIFSVNCNEDLDMIRQAYDNRIVVELTFNIMHYFKNIFMIKKFNPTKFKFEYEWNSSSNAVYLYLISTAEQTFYLNHRKITISKNKKYHVIRSRRFKKKFIDDVLMLNNFDTINSFTDEKNRMLVCIAQKQ